jgi:hypothetical protein
MFEADRAEVGWSSPPNWEFSAEEIRAGECHSKSNQDRESCHLVMVEGESQLAEGMTVEPSTPKARLGDGALDRSAPITPLAAPVVPSPRSKSAPVEAKHRSSRAARSVEPVLERAMRATAEKNDIGKSPLAPFAVLPWVSDSHLLKVAADSLVLFCRFWGNLWR